MFFLWGTGEIFFPRNNDNTNTLYRNHAHLNNLIMANAGGAQVISTTKTTTNHGHYLSTSLNDYGGHRSNFVDKIDSSHCNANGIPPAPTTTTNDKVTRVKYE